MVKQNTVDHLHRLSAMRSFIPELWVKDRVKANRLQNSSLDSSGNFLVRWVLKTNCLVWFLYPKENPMVLPHRIVLELNTIIHDVCTGISLQFPKVHPPILSYYNMTLGYATFGK